MKKIVSIFILFIMLCTGCTDSGNGTDRIDSTNNGGKTETKNVDTEAIQDKVAENETEKEKPDADRSASGNIAKDNVIPDITVDLNEDFRLSEIEVPYYENYRIIDSISYDKEIILIYRNKENRSENKIISYNESTGKEKIIIEEDLSFTGGEKKYITDSLVVIAGAKNKVHIDKHTKEILFVENVSADDFSYMSYDRNYEKFLVRTDDYIEVAIDKWRFIQYENTDLFNYHFEWLDNKAIAYYTEDNKLKIIDIENAKLLVLDLNPFMPKRFVDYYEIYWLSDNELVFTALCEENVVLQILDIASNKIVYEYTYGRDGFVIDIIDNTILTMNIDGDFSVVAINTVDYSEKKIVTSDAPIQFVTVNADTLDIYFDIYMEKASYQSFNKIENFAITTDEEIREKDFADLYKNDNIDVTELKVRRLTED